MNLIKQLRRKGFAVRFIKETGMIGIAPKEKVTEEIRAFVIGNRESLIDEIKNRKEFTGTTLRAVIGWCVPSFLLRRVDEKTCNCQIVEEYMNDWGVDVCCLERRKLIGHLYIKSEPIKVLPRIARLVGAATMLEIAILFERAKRNGMWKQA